MIAVAFAAGIAALIYKPALSQRMHDAIAQLIAAARNRLNRHE